MLTQSVSSSSCSFVGLFLGLWLKSREPSNCSKPLFLRRSILSGKMRGVCVRSHQLQGRGSVKSKEGLCSVSALLSVVCVSGVAVSVVALSCLVGVTAHVHCCCCAVGHFVAFVGVACVFVFCISLCSKRKTRE